MVYFRSMKNSLVKSAVLLLPFVLLTAGSPAEAATASSTEAEVREYFADIPVMIEIARCESKFRQFTDSGNVLRGGMSGGMVGVFQFYESIHTGAAKALGFDLATLEGNMAYARHVYNAQGTAPWDSAKFCWDVLTSSTSLSSTDRTRLLAQINTLTKLITLLKQQLEEQRSLS